MIRWCTWHFPLNAIQTSITAAMPVYCTRDITEPCICAQIVWNSHVMHCTIFLIKESLLLWFIIKNYWWFITEKYILNKLLVVFITTNQTELKVLMLLYLTCFSAMLIMSLIIKIYIRFVQYFLAVVSQVCVPSQIKCSRKSTFRFSILSNFC